MGNTLNPVECLGNSRGDQKLRDLGSWVPLPTLRLLPNASDPEPEPEEPVDVHVVFFGETVDLDIYKETQKLILERLGTSGYPCHITSSYVSSKSHTPEETSLGIGKGASSQAIEKADIVFALTQEDCRRLATFFPKEVGKIRTLKEWVTAQAGDLVDLDDITPYVAELDSRLMFLYDLKKFTKILVKV